MRVVHIVPGIEDVANGMAVVARLIANEQGDAEVVDLNHGMHRIHGKGVEEVWVHGMWLPREWRVCRAALKAGKRLVRMTHGSLSPIYLERQGKWKKRLAGPIEKWLLRKASCIVATCAAEKEWIEAYLGGRCPKVEVTDIKRFFTFSHKEHKGHKDFSRIEHVERVEGGDCFNTEAQGHRGAEQDGELPSADGGLHLLYLGRRHPLKGLEYLEEAVRQMQNDSNPVNPVNPVKNSSTRSPCSAWLTPSAPSASLRLCVKIISSAFGEEREKAWDWCDVLVLPTLSENFGLVVAEALERGKCVITTDGAPAWEEGLELVSGGVGSGEIWSGYGGRLVYLKGYRDGSKENRVKLLKGAIRSVALRPRCAWDVNEDNILLSTNHN